MSKLKTDFKNTEIGPIPQDWEVKMLGEICSPSKNRINPLTSEENHICIELEHLSQGSGILLGYANSKELKSQKSVFQKGDVLFGKLRPYLRKFLLADFNGVCTTEIWVLKTEKDTSNRFLYQLIQSEKIIEAANLSTGTKMPRAEWKTVSETKIPLPPTLAEQTAIATALSDADALISGLEKLIAKKRHIKQGAMQKLLQPKEDWQVKKLGEVGEVRMCKRIFNYETSSNATIPFYKIGTFGKEPDAYISIEQYNDYRKRFSFPKKGDILISAAGTIGRTIIYDGFDAYFQDSNIVWIDNDESIVSNKFLFHIFQIIKYNTEGGTIQRLYNSILKATVFFCPLLVEQTRIATILSDMDTEIGALERKLDKYRKVKLGMMQNLLTGKIRLV